MPTEPRMVTLRTGTTIPAATATAVMAELTGLAHLPIVLYELASMARDPQHIPANEDVRDVIAGHHLITADGAFALAPDVGAVVLAATQGGDLNLRLRSPYGN